MTEPPAKGRRPVVHYPADLERSGYTGPLWGLHHPDSNETNVLAYAGPEPPALPQVGYVHADLASGLDAAGSGLTGYRENGALVFWQDGRRCERKPYDLKLDVFSRNSGILETDAMLDSRVLISGCGSVGSLVALELARAGVGHFLLVDPETLSYENLCRHQCGRSDVGKFKAHALRERILEVNSLAEVVAETTAIEQLALPVLDRFMGERTAVVGCADNREGDVRANEIACHYGVPFVSIGCWERAFAGEIFYTIPGLMPCYACPFGRGGGELSGRVSANRRLYTTDMDLEKTSFMPGISSDISFVTIVGVKFVLDLLNRSLEGYTPRVLDSLSQFTLVCNSTDPRLGGELAEIFSYPLQVTTSIQVDYQSPCPPCRLAPHVEDQ